MPPHRYHLVEDTDLRLKPKDFFLLHRNTNDLTMKQ
jgi:hypothetical protein